MTTFVAAEPWLVTPGHTFTSRLLVGLEQLADIEMVKDVLEAAGPAVPNAQSMLGLLNHVAGV